MRFGKYLRSKRRQTGLTQEDLARGIKVSNTYIHQLETGKIDAPTERRCRQLARILGVDPEQMWMLARRERLESYAERTGLDINGDLDVLNGEVDGEFLNQAEKALIKLYRKLDDETRQEFNSLMIMLFRRIPEKDLQLHLKEYMRVA
jgi:transcriptional regulator with XRE-family HTH domain